MKPIRTILLPMALFGASATLAAQWKHLPILDGGPAHFLAGNAAHAFVGTRGAGVFMSADQGATWTTIADMDNSPVSMHVASMAANAGQLFVLGSRETALTRNLFKYDIAANRWRADSIFGSEVIVHAGSIYVCGTGAPHLYRSRDGNGWEKIATGILDSGAVRSGFVGSMKGYGLGDTLFARLSETGSAPLLMSDDRGATWRKHFPLPPNVESGYGVGAGRVWVSAFDAIYSRPIGGGSGWEKLDVIGIGDEISAMAFQGKEIVLVTNTGAFLSGDSGTTFAPIDVEDLGTMKEEAALLPVGAEWLLVSESPGILKTSRAGGAVSARKSARGFHSAQVTALASREDALYAFVHRSGWHVSRDGGATWKGPLAWDLKDQYHRYSVSEGFVTTGNGGLFRIDAKTDQAIAWGDQGYLASPVLHQGRLFGVSLDSLFASSDSGRTWVSTAALPGDLPSAARVGLVSAGRLMLYFRQNLYAYNEPARQWIPQTRLDIALDENHPMHAHGDTLVWSDEYGINSMQAAGGSRTKPAPFLSIDPEFYGRNAVTPLYRSGRSLLAGRLVGIAYSSDDGRSFTGLPALGAEVTGFAQAGNVLFVSTRQRGLFAYDLNGSSVFGIRGGRKRVSAGARIWFGSETPGSGTAYSPDGRRVEIDGAWGAQLGLPPTSQQR